MILGFTYLFTGHRDYSAAGHAANPLLPGPGHLVRACWRP